MQQLTGKALRYVVFVDTKHERPLARQIVCAEDLVENRAARRKVLVATLITQRVVKAMIHGSGDQVRNGAQGDVQVGMGQHRIERDEGEEHRQRVERKAQDEERDDVRQVDIE